MGFPILVKAVMGGGGKGMKLAMAAGELRVCLLGDRHCRMTIEFVSKGQSSAQIPK